MTSPSYRHTQSGKLIIWVTMVGIGVSAAMAAHLFSVRDYPVAIVSAGMFLLLAVVAWLFRSLTVEVSASQVKWYFGSGLWSYTENLTDIDSAQAVRNPWWFGWGIRLTPHGWLYNVSGFDAVELGLADGKHCRIGTDEPRRLAEAIDLAKATA